MEQINFYGEKYSGPCPGCDRIEPQKPALAKVYETNHMRVHQDYALPIPGMMVIESKRHIAKLDELTPEERIDLVEVWSKIDVAIKETLGVKDVIHVLEDRSLHFHFWLMPIHPWMKDVTSNKLRNMQTIFDHVKNEMITSEWITKTEEATKLISEFVKNK